MHRPTRNWLPIKLSQHYIVGKDGMPVVLVTRSRIRALDTLREVVFAFDTNELHVEGVSGCVATPVTRDVYQPDKYWATTLRLDDPLNLGQEAQLTYLTLYYYSSPPPNELVQNGAARGIEQVSLRVDFHSHKLPTKVWWELCQDNQVLEKGSPKLTPVSPEMPELGSYVEHELAELLPHRQLAIRWQW